MCFGEVLLRLSSPGKELLLQSPRFEAHVGGAEANVAVSLRRLGHPSRLVSALPDSPLGRACLAELRRHAVDTAGVLLCEGRLGLYFLTHGAGHRAAEVLYDRAGSAFAITPADVYDWRGLVQGADWLHVSGVTPAISAATAQAALAALSTARELGVQTSFDCNFRSRLWGARAPQAPGLLRSLCELADLIFGDERDIAFMLNARPGASADNQTRRRFAADAAFGAFSHLQFIASTSRTRDHADVQQLTGHLHSRCEAWTSRAYALHGVVDRIGAGDAFAAGVLHGLLSGFERQKVVDFAAAAACLKHSIPGDFNWVEEGDVEWLLSRDSADVRR